jgi:glycosyltransferase involved in cell wall biosynthesis
MDGNILVSPSEMDLLIRYIPSLDRKKLFLVPNGIDVDPEIPLPREMTEACSQYEQNIITLSRLSHQKDLITMIEAFGIIGKENPRAALHILGGETPQDREYADKVRERLSSSPVRDRIKLWGSVENAGSLVRHFDLYWTTALFEGLPTAVVEAALSRTLIVGTECTGNVDVIIPDKTGILTEAGNPESNAEGVIKALNLLGTEKADQLMNSAESLCLNFSRENNARKLKELYNTEKILE